ncbi:MAG: tRNA pseudouridine(38-40) synthase TruA [Euryarchaeota archaeon RBG_13_31_8]|nr:MAG: tRNA pseudouridine(38-40) synthase TruA [Euryarchaeota archaeon RBG_13_31_8]
MRIALKFAYNGIEFQGYARQPKLKTVEGEIIDSLIQNNIINDVKESKFRSTSRTDKGTSALGNVIAFNTLLTKNLVFKKLRNNKKSILFYGIKNVEPDFYPRYAKLRIYSYYLKKQDFDIEKIIDISSIFLGEHNFSNFARVEADKNPIRTIENIVLTEQDYFFIIDFYAQTFLWHQIRRIISAIVKFASKKLTKEKIEEALNNPNVKVDYGLAPAEPLILKNVFYDFEFDYEKNYLKKLKEFETNIVLSYQN